MKVIYLYSNLVNICLQVCNLFFIQKICIIGWIKGWRLVETWTLSSTVRYYIHPLVHSQVLYPPSRPQSGIISTLSSTVRYYIHPPPGPWSSTVRYYIHHPPGPWSSSRPQSGIISILPSAPDRPLVHSLVLYPYSPGIISILPPAPYRPLVHSLVLYPPSRPQSGIISILSGPLSSSCTQSGIISTLSSLVRYLYPFSPRPLIVLLYTVVWYYINPLVHIRVLYPPSPRPLIILSSTVWYYIHPLVHSQVLYPFSTRPLIVLKFIKLLLLSLVFNFALIKIWQLFTLSFIILKNGRWTLSSHY